MIKLSTAVLVGGKSRRMKGKNKSFLKYDNQAFIDHILSQLADFDERLLSVATRVEYESYSDLVEDEVKEVGPLGGLYTCLKRCRNEYLFICATDMPLIKKELIEFMREFISSDYDCYVIESDAKVHPLCGIYHKRILPVIEQMMVEKNYRMMELLRRVNVKYIPLQYSCFDESVVANINQPREWLMLKKPAVFCVSGVKNSGKTTLITELIKAFNEEGYRVGVIKHDGHEFEIDIEGTDSYQYRQAGSEAAVIYSQTQYALIQSWKSVDVEQLISYLTDMDLIMVEGLKHSHYPKVEVVREKMVCQEQNLLAIVTDSDFQHERVKTLKRHDISALIAIIKKEVMGCDERWI